MPDDARALIKISSKRPARPKCEYIWAYKASQVNTEMRCRAYSGVPVKAWYSIHRCVDEPVESSRLSVIVSTIAWLEIEVGHSGVALASASVSWGEADSLYASLHARQSRAYGSPGIGFALEQQHVKFACSRKHGQRPVPPGEIRRPLSNHFAPMRHVVPHDVPIQVAAAGEENTAFRALRQAVGELHVFTRLRPAR